MQNYVEPIMQLKSNNGRSKVLRQQETRIMDAGVPAEM